MQVKTIEFRILRFKPHRIDPPRFEPFAVTAGPMTTVLDGLEEIRLAKDATLMYRHCCHHASCGTCACTINGAPALACTTRIADLKTRTVTLEPLAHFDCLGDLVVDMRHFYKEMDSEWKNTRRCETSAPERTPDGVDGLMRLENCIECGCCVAGCPVTPESNEFMGPAVLAALNNEIRNQPDRRMKLLQMAADPRGVVMCRRHLACSRVCPSKVYPARHIADLQRRINRNDGPITPTEGGPPKQKR